jgi:excisionase family DNA binding protein
MAIPLNVDEAAKQLRLSRVTLYRLLRKGTVPHHRIAGRYFFYQSDIDELLSQSAVPARRAIAEVQA